MDTEKEQHNTKSYLYLIDYKYIKTCNVPTYDQTILKFDNIDDITIENIKNRILGYNTSTFKIEKITVL